MDRAPQDADHDLWQIGRLVARPDQRLNRARSVCFSSTDRGRHSGNEHSSAYRQLPVVIFKWLPPSDASMMCVEVSDVTMPLAPEVRLQHETSAEIQGSLPRQSPRRCRQVKTECATCRCEFLENLFSCSVPIASKRSSSENQEPSLIGLRNWASPSQCWMHKGPLTSSNLFSIVVVVKRRERVARYSRYPLFHLLAVGRLAPFSD